MTSIARYASIVALACFVLVPVPSSAHQPRITEGRQTVVSDPEVSKAYYGELAGEPDLYIISSSEPFELYVNVLVPDIADQKKDISAVVLKDGAQVALLDGVNFEWTQFYEPFGADTYWMGPEYKAPAEAGVYEVRVWSTNNDSKYSLAIGEKELFDRRESWNALTLIPQLKKDFFNKSPIGFILSPFGIGLIVAMYALAVVFGFAYRAVLKRVAKGTVRAVGHNIGKPDRTVRFVLGVALLLWAVTTTWSPLLLFFSGFCFFEAAFSWCGFYAALGRTTCPVE